MSKAKKQKSSKSSVVSAKELKSWLRGAMEFQPSDWTPTAEQWAAIRDRIFNLEEVEFETSYSVSNHGQYAPEPTYAPVQAFPVAAPTVAYAPVVQPVVQSALGGASANPDSGRLAVNHSPTESGLVPVSSQTTVLEGEYKSPF